MHLKVIKHLLVMGLSCDLTASMPKELKKFSGEFAFKGVFSGETNSNDLDVIIDHKRIINIVINIEPSSSKMIKASITNTNRYGNNFFGRWTDDGTLYLTQHTSHSSSWIKLKYEGSKVKGVLRIIEADTCIFIDYNIEGNRQRINSLTPD